MELLTITLAAGQTQQFAKAGRYVEIIDSTYPIRIDFVGDKGQQTDSMTSALSGLFMEVSFAAMAITNGASPQTVTLLVMESQRGGSRRQPGIVSVSNKIGAGVVTVGFVAALAVGFTAVQLVAPGANVRGVLVRRTSVSVQASAGAAVDGRMVMAPVLPASMVPSASLQMAAAYSASAVLVSDQKNDLNYQVPAGWGVYFVCTQVTAAGAAAGGEWAFELL